MNKYTIIKSFEKDVDFPIWKIEVDSTANCIALECRNPENTLPLFSVFDFNGNNLLTNFMATEKEWTLETIQGDYLILKRFGTSSPIQAGIQIIHIPTGKVQSTFMEYTLKEVYEGILEARHRSIPSGLNYYIRIDTGETQTKTTDLQNVKQDITHPISYEHQVPQFINNLKPIDQIWLQPYLDLFIWAYHTQESEKFKLNLALSSKNEILDNKIIFEGLNKLIPQPYFAVKEHIFFLSDNKKKIETYLVLL